MLSLLSCLLGLVAVIPCTGAQEKLKVLINGWIHIPHSYAVVNCMQLIHLYKNYGDKLDIYVNEPKYFNNEYWDTKRAAIYTDEYNNILRIFKQFNRDEDDYDIEMRVSFPHNFTIGDKSKPVLLFYTTLVQLYAHEVELNGLTGPEQLSDVMMIDHVEMNPNIFFVTPTPMSSNGMRPFIPPNEWDLRHKVLTHGVDLSLVYKDFDKADERKKLRNKNGINDDDIVLLNVGALSGNKGVPVIISALNLLIKTPKYAKTKLLLKCVSLYLCEGQLTKYLEDLVKAGIMEENDGDNLITNHILFMDSTLTSENLNMLYNVADVYVSPYYQEGFNLPVLEAIAAGLPTIVTENGCTKVYVDEIKANVPNASKYIHTMTMQFEGNDQFEENMYSLLAIIKRQYSSFGKPMDKTYYEKMRAYIEDNLSWNKVSHLLFDHLSELVANWS